MARRRVTINDLPSTPAPCLIKRPCVYRSRAFVCDNAQTNSRNIDSACFLMNNGDILDALRAGLNAGPSVGNIELRRRVERLTWPM